MVNPFFGGPGPYFRRGPFYGGPGPFYGGGPFYPIGGPFFGGFLGSFLGSSLARPRYPYYGRRRYW